VQKNKEKTISIIINLLGLSFIFVLVFEGKALAKPLEPTSAS